MRIVFITVAIAALGTTLPSTAQSDEMALQRCIWQCLAQSKGNDDPAYHACAKKHCSSLKPAADATPAAQEPDGGTAGNRLDVPVLEQGGDGQAANCASSVVAGLKAGGDGFLAVRSGPGTEYRKIDELQNGDVVYVYDRKGDWVGIAYEVSNLECVSKTTRPVPYGKTGWVHGGWLRDLAG